MFRIRLAAVAVLVAVFALVSAQTAQAHYAIPAVTLDVDPNTLEGEGEVDGHAESDQDCNTWDVFNDFDGQTASGSGTSIDFTWEFPEVDETTDVTITAVCVSGEEDAQSLGGGSRGSLSTGVVAAVQTGTASETITLLAEGDDDGDDDGDGDGKDDDNGGLPDTGGTEPWVIVAGAALLLAGGGAVYFARQRREDTA